MNSATTGIKVRVLSLVRRKDAAPAGTPRVDQEADPDLRGGAASPTQAALAQVEIPTWPRRTELGSRT